MRRQRIQGPETSAGWILWRDPSGLMEVTESRFGFLIVEDMVEDGTNYEL